MRGKYLYKFVIVLLFAVGFVAFAPNTYAITGDSDNVPDVTEDAAPNTGDNNYDGSTDSTQNNVASTQNPNDIENPNSWVSLEIGNPRVDEVQPNWQIDEFNPIDPSTLPSQPDGSVFPVGMFNAKLSCTEIEGDCSSNTCYLDRVLTDQINELAQCGQVGGSVNVRLLFDRVMDTSNWTTRKYNPVTDTYEDYGAYVTISTQNIGFDRTVIEWTLTDGGFGDADGIINGSISDPIGPTVPIATSTSAVIVPTAAKTVSGPTLANTGFGTNLLISIAVILIAASVVIFPKRSLQ